MTGACFMLAYLQFDLTPELFQTLVLISICAIVFVTDITYMIIPNKVLLFFLPLFTIFNVINPSTDWYNNFFGAVTGFLLIGFIILISRGGMGIGDMKLLGLFGLLLGFERTLLTFFIAVCVGSIIGIGLMLGKKRSSQHAIPFAPFLVLGAIMSMMYGDDMIAVYLSLLQV